MGKPKRPPPSAEEWKEKLKNAERLPDVSEECFFSVKNLDTGHEWKIFANGKIEGFGKLQSLVVVNKIPQLVAAAAELGYSEAESLKEIPETSEE